MSLSTTSFTYNATTVTMDVNPLHSRSYEEDQEIVSGYNSDGTCYAYDIGAPVFRTETVTFPAITATNLQSLISFIETTTSGPYRTFTWNDMGTTRTARYKGMTWQQVGKIYHQVELTLEVVL